VLKARRPTLHIFRSYTTAEGLKAGRVDKLLDRSGRYKPSMCISTDVVYTLPTFKQRRK